MLGETNAGGAPGISTSLCADLASWTGAFDGTTLSDLGRSRAEAAIRDVLGCIFAGAHEAAVSAVGRAASGWGAGDSRRVGSAAPVPAPVAALINGTAAHVLDFDDNFFPAISHASAVLVPALLAVGDELNAAWPDLIEAYVAGLEVQARLGTIANPRHYESGWHATSTLGTIGAAAACAKLRGLSVQETAWAISLGASLAGGSKLQFGTAAKPLHAGLAAMHGVMAAQLAASGIDAATGIFEGEWGFLAHHAAETTRVIAPWGALAIEQGGLVAKLYPSCMSSHLGIDALRELGRRERLEAEAIEWVELEMPRLMVDNLRFSAPVTVTEARFSMNYCAALALVEGIPTLAHFTDAAIARPDLRALARRVAVIVREPQAAAMALPWGGDVLARLILRDGRVLETIVAEPKGSASNPLSADEADAKFRECCRQSLAEPDFDALSTLLAAPSETRPTRDLTHFFGLTPGDKQ